MSKICQFSSIPIYNGNIGCTKKWINDINCEEFKKYPPGSGFQIREKNGYGTIDQKILNKYPNILSKISSCIDDYLYNFIEIDRRHLFKITRSWANIHEQNDWGHKHNHTSDFTGILYISVNSKSGNVNFYKPHFHFNIFNSEQNIQYSNENQYNVKIKKVLPINGDIIIFPSFIYHGVDINQSDEKRISLAFDIELNR